MQSNCINFFHARLKECYFVADPASPVSTPFAPAVVRKALLEELVGASKSRRKKDSHLARPIERRTWVESKLKTLTSPYAGCEVPAPYMLGWPVRLSPT